MIDAQPKPMEGTCRKCGRPMALPGADRSLVAEMLCPDCLWAPSSPSLAAPPPVPPSAPSPVAPQPPPDDAAARWNWYRPPAERVPLFDDPTRRTEQPRPPAPPPPRFPAAPALGDAPTAAIPLPGAAPQSAPPPTEEEDPLTAPTRPVESMRSSAPPPPAPKPPPDVWGAPTMMMMGAGSLAAPVPPPAVPSPPPAARPAAVASPPPPPPPIPTPPAVPAGWRPAEAAVPDGPLPAGTRIGGYVIEGLIASGSMGSVYRAHEADLRRDVAIKFPSATDELSRRRFLREARLAAGLRHSHIVAVFAVGEFGGRPYIVTEYVPGGSLDQRVRKAGPLWPGPAARLIAQAARALDVAHARGVVHRDVKPANLLLTDNGEAMVTDFGLARPLTPPAAEDGTPPSAALTGEGVLVGTPQYMAPELGRGAPAGPAGDIYALGCTFHYLMTGEHPFQAASAFEVLRMHAELPFPDIRARLPKIPHRLAAALRRAVEKDPARRFASAGEMADELEAALDDPGVWDSLRTSLSSISVPVVQGLTGLGETGPLSAVPPAARPWLIGGAVLLAALAGLWVLRKIAAGLGF